MNYQISKLIPSLLNLINWLQMMTLKNQNEISFKKKQRSKERFFDDFSVFPKSNNDYGKI